MPFNFSKLSVLVVEDTEPMRKLIVSILDSIDVGTVHQAKSGEEGFRRFCEHNPDIVISDWDMGPGDGLIMTRKIRKDVFSPNRLAPIIFLTGYNAVKRVAQARDAGATEYIIKPFTGSDLAKRIAYVINKPRDYIDADGYFGPDRRRRDSPDYTGPRRRDGDESSFSGDEFLIDIDSKK
jgi:CheY-like chemotaxis protein